MTFAKVTSFLGGFIYLLLFGFALVFGETLNATLSENFGLENSSAFALILATAFLVAVANFCFSYLIQKRETYHEQMESAFFFSLQLLIIPLIVFIGIVVIFVNLG